MRADWVSVKRSYIEGNCSDGRHSFPTLRALAEQFDVSESAVLHRAADEEWTLQRASYLQKIASQSTELVAERLAEKLGETEVDLRLQTYERFSSIEDAALSLIFLPSASPNEKLKVRFDVTTRELKAVAEVLRICTEQKRLARGMSTDKQEVELSGDPISEVLKKIAEGRDASRNDAAKQHSGHSG